MDTSVFKVQAHSSMINCIDGCGGLNVGSGSPELATGSRDGCVRVWDPRTDKAVVNVCLDFMLLFCDGLCWSASRCFFFIF